MNLLYRLLLINLVAASMNAQSKPFVLRFWNLSDPAHNSAYRDVAIANPDLAAAWIFLVPDPDYAEQLVTVVGRSDSTTAAEIDKIPSGDVSGSPSWFIVYDKKQLIDLNQSPLKTPPSLPMFARLLMVRDSGQAIILGAIELDKNDVGLESRSRELRNWISDQDHPVFLFGTNLGIPESADLNDSRLYRSIIKNDRTRRLAPPADSLTYCRQGKPTSVRL